MPTYCYGCQDCGESFEVRHRMSYEDQTCLFCSSEKVFRYPQGSYKKAPNEREVAKPTGKVVDDYIKETKEVLKREKEELRKREV